MKINSNSGSTIRPASVTPSSTDKLEKSSVSPSSAVTTAAGRNDKVQISDAGRALAARDGSAPSSLNPERAAQIRQRVLDGAYNSLGVVDEVARRILNSGDL